MENPTRNAAMAAWINCARVISMGPHGSRTLSLVQDKKRGRCVKQIAHAQRAEKRLPAAGVGERIGMNEQLPAERRCGVKIISIVGSRSEKGQTARAGQAFVKGARGAGHEVEEHYLPKMQYRALPAM